MGDMKIAAVETGHRIQLPADWAAELGMDETVALEKTSEVCEQFIRELPGLVYYGSHFA